MMAAPWLITLITVILVFWLERIESKYIRSIFDWIPAILLAYIIPAIISASFNVDFSSADIHQYSKDYFIPITILLVMSSLSIGQLKAIGWKPIAVFVSGSFWIAVFPILFCLVFIDSELVSGLLMEQEYWKGAVPIVGSWIGGSTSQLVLKEIVACPEALFLSVLVMDNILVNIWTIFMFQGIKKSKALNKKLKITNTQMPDELTAVNKAKLNKWWCVLLVLLTVLGTNYLVDSFVAKIIILSLVGLLFSNLLPKWNHAFVLKAGGVFIVIVMAVLGLKLRFDSLGFSGYFFGFLIVWLGSHFFIMLLVAKWLNVNTAWVPIASMANVGGIATAPAVTAAYEKKWMPHAIILAILSMATGTFWGMLTIYLFEVFLV
jgi:uncharacterized membrane protein